MTIKQIECFSCKATVPDIEGPSHKYRLSSPGCWKLYGEILAKEYTLGNYDPNVHRITVDTYAVSHPGEPERKSIQSVNIHLVSMYTVLENNLPGHKATHVLRKLVENKEVTERLQWLEPPSFKETLHVTDVLKARDMKEHEALVLAWGRSVFDVWKQKHFQTIERLGRWPDTHLLSPLTG